MKSAPVVGANVVLGALIFCLLRFGLLSVIGGIFMMATMNEAILTWDLRHWYAGSSLVTLTVVLVITLWAFSISLAGRSLFKDFELD